MRVRTIDYTVSSNWMNSLSKCIQFFHINPFLYDEILQQIDVGYGKYIIKVFDWPGQVYQQRNLSSVPQVFISSDNPLSLAKNPLKYFVKNNYFFTQVELIYK